MNRWVVVLFFCFLFVDLLQAQAPKGQMNEEVLSDELCFTILNAKESSLERKCKVVILNDQADDYNRIILFYSKFRKIVSMKVVISDKNGNKIRQLGIKDAQDYLAGGVELATDTRFKVLDINNNRYPYIVEISYRIDFKNSLFYPSWSPVSNVRQGVRRSTLIVSDPLNLGVRYRGLNVGEPEIVQDKDGFRYTWEVENIPPYTEEFFAKPSLLWPAVYLAPKNFEVEGYKGNMESWENFGHWINLLNKGKNDLTPEDVAEVKRLCDAEESVKDKVKAAYRYMQGNTRYISVQLGIGGWQPFPASQVHRKKYGDCKALSFYMKSLLDAVGIPSYYTLIRAGENVDSPVEHFSCNMFNHAILTVPLEQDTIWLECTSQNNPFGYLGSFTSDRYALMITPEGGRLFKTRTYTAEENVTSNDVQIIMDEQGNARIELECQYSGLAIESNGFMRVVTRTEKEKREWILENSSFGALEMERYEITPIKGEEVPVAGYSLYGTSKRFAVSSGSRLTFSPMAFASSGESLLPSSERVFPIEVRYASLKKDTITISLPEGFAIESLFAPLSIENKYGCLEMKVIPVEDKLQIIRYFRLNAGVYPPEEYGEFRSFINKVRSQEKSRIVLIKQPTPVACILPASLSEVSLSLPPQHAR